MYLTPPYPSLGIKVFDLSIGLLLVAASEEILFRGILIKYLKRFLKSNFLVGMISLILFAGIHYGMGFAPMMAAFTWGIIPTIFAIKYESINELIAIHFLTNLVLFY
ncbi:MAG: membrane protease YdiL (CAAX protease family) [Bacteriovoracaceae bacterium]|jgi:membrane protease YdiL (CAAX protease family)